MCLGTPALPALAQNPAPPPAGIYTCIDERGHRITADRPIAACAAKEQQLLNRDGSLRAIIPPTLTAEERAEQEARRTHQAWPGRRRIQARAPQRRATSMPTSRPTPAAAPIAA